MLSQRHLGVRLSPVPRHQADHHAHQQEHHQHGEGEAEDAPLRHPPATVWLFDHDGPLLVPPVGGNRKQSSQMALELNTLCRVQLDGSVAGKCRANLLKEKDRGR